MSNVRKRGNSYTYRKKINGHTYSFSFTHEPTTEEIIKNLSEKLAENNDTSDKESVHYYAKKYIEKCRSRKKSSTTINSYKSIVKNTPDWFLKYSFQKVTSDTLKKVIEEYSSTTNSNVKERSPKTISNFRGFYKAVLSEFRPNSKINVKLPNQVKKMEYNPTTKDVKRLIEYCKGTDYELFIRFACIGLRRGEIKALSSNDLSDDNILTINKDYIKGEDKKYYIKEVPKTSASNRRILIPGDIADMLRKQGVVYEGSIDNINKYLTRSLKHLEIPHFRLHILRHFTAAYLLKNGFTREQVLEYGGWEKGSSVMEKVYAYNLDPEESQQPIANAFNSLF